MSQYINAAAIESWRELDRTIDEPLRDLMQKNGITEHVFETWISEMVQNGVDSMVEISDVEKQPKRIKRAG